MSSVTYPPPAPELPSADLKHVPVPAPGWRVAEGDVRCRDARGGPGICGRPAVAEADLHRGAGSVWPWYGYCAEHAAARGCWVQGGQVMTWGLRNADGSELTREQAAKAQRASRGQPEDGPEATGLYSIRIRGDLRSGAKAAAELHGEDLAAWVRQAMEARQNYLRCPRCRAPAPPVPVEFGDLTGRLLDEWIADAVTTLKAQHPWHEPVVIGAQPAPLPQAVFRPPVPDHSGKKGRRAS